MRRVGSALSLVAALGCSVEVSIDGKQCPCIDGYVCDPISESCVVPSCTPLVSTSDFTAAWATANGIRWTWEPHGTGEQLLRYELVVAETRDDLASKSGSARVYDVDVNPELGAFTHPFVGGVVTGTTSYGLDAGTSYQAQLVATDTELCASGSEVVAKATTPEPPSSLVIYRDDIAAGAATSPAPPAFSSVANGSGAHLEYAPMQDMECNPEVPDVEDIRATCGQPLRIEQLNQDLSHNPSQPSASRLTSGSFGTAYLEMRVSNASPVASFFSLVWLRFADCVTEETIFRFDGWTLPNTDDYVTLQFPLAILANGTRALDYGDIDTTAGGAPLCGVALGGQWHKTATVRIDDVVIRY